jgi:hypothetical protein
MDRSRIPGAHKRQPGLDPGLVNRGDSALQVDNIDGADHIRYAVVSSVPNRTICRSPSF